MSNVTISFIRRRFERIICPAMGWTYTEGFKLEGGYVFIEKTPSPGRYRVVERPANTTGEKNLCDPMTKNELMAWMDGILRASDVFNARKKG